MLPATAAKRSGSTTPICTSAYNQLVSQCQGHSSRAQVAARHRCEGNAGKAQECKCPVPAMAEGAASASKFSGSCKQSVSRDDQGRSFLNYDPYFFQQILL
ncbi:TPA: hypothetical protein ACH3X2_007639 [Trebouxia sp. C0005]